MSVFSKKFDIEKYPIQFAAVNLFTVEYTVLLTFRRQCVVRKQLLCSLFDLKLVQYENIILTTAAFVDKKVL